MQSTLRRYGSITLTAVWSMASLLAPAARPQVFSWTKEQMVEYTKAWTGERFPDGRPKVPDSWLERAKGLSQEEVLIPFERDAGPPNIASFSQFDGNFKVLHPELKMAGRVVTAMYMPTRADIDSILFAKARAQGVALTNQWPLDQLQPGDVMVIDMYGKVDGGGIIGDNLFYYIKTATKGGGVVINGSLRDLEGIDEIKLPAYVRTVTPTWFGGSTLYGYNVPVRMGGVVVMPGDIAFGDKEGVAFIPPTMAESILDKADETHIHDEWTKLKFEEGKYRSTDIYPSPIAEGLRKEYQEYQKRRLAELKAARVPGKK